MLGIIINPHSGKKTFRAQRLYLFRLLKQRREPFTYKVTAYMNHAMELARELVEKGCDRILVLGGDGTLSEVINGIMSSKVEDKSKIQVGLMPRGTGNDWGRYWGLTKNYRASLDIFFNHPNPTPIDIGCVNYKRNGEEYQQYFINSVGFGVDALTCKMTHTMKYYVGSHKQLYFFSLLAAICKHKSVPMGIETDGDFQNKEVLYTMNIANGPFSGGGIKQNPEADPTDGIFHAMFISRITWKLICQAIPKLFNGRLQEAEMIRFFTAKEIRMLTKHHTVFEADGIVVDACGPYTITLIPHALQFIGKA